MEPLKASMIPTTRDFSAPNGSGAIATSDPSRRTSRSFTIRTTGIAASRGRRPCKSSRKTASARSSHLPSTNYPRSARKSRRGPFPSSVSFAATKSWISLESISPFRSLSSIPMFGRKSLPAPIRSSFTAAMNWLRPSLTSYRLGWTFTLETPFTKKKHERCTLHQWDKPSRKLSTAPPLSCS